jgi:hypothetical protein
LSGVFGGLRRGAEECGEQRAHRGEVDSHGGQSSGR